MKISLKNYTVGLCGLVILLLSVVTATHGVQTNADDAEAKRVIASKIPGVMAMTSGTACYDQSRYFCQSTTCLPGSYPNDISMCNMWFNGFGAPCPANATCIGGKYRCDYGYTDSFSLDEYISDPSDCTVCNKPRGCIRDPSIPFIPSSNSQRTEYYSSSLTISLGDLCGKSIIADGCSSSDRYGDQYFLITDIYGLTVAYNDDTQWGTCSYLDYNVPSTGACSSLSLTLRCYNYGSYCGGSVYVTVSGGASIPPCPQGTYYNSGNSASDACVTCPAGTTNSGTGNLFCNQCTGNYMGYEGTAPCVACPMGTVANNGSTACVTCNSQALTYLSNDHTAYDNCLSQLLGKVSTLDQRIDVFMDRFESFLVDTKYKEPTFPPTMRPTRRRRSSAPHN